MRDHECVIGIVHERDYSKLVTLSELKLHAEDRAEMARAMNGDPLFKNFPEMKCWSVSEYADKRKSTDFTRFEHCPYCGQKIDWKGIKQEEA